MKFVLLLLAVLGLVWMLRGSLRRGAAPPQAKPGAPSGPQTMVRCVQCGIHLPQGEALPGRGGVFCGDAHRAEYEKAHPGA